jgi:hypothetical protein
MFFLSMSKEQKFIYAYKYVKNIMSITYDYSKLFFFKKASNVPKYRVGSTLAC